VGESIGLGCGVIFHATHAAETDEAAPADAGPQPLPRNFMDFLCQSNELFPQLTADLEQHSGIHIETESGTGLLYVIYNDSEQQYANKLLDWLSGSDTPVEQWTAAQARSREPLLTRDLLGGIYFPGDNQVNPMLLADACRRSSIKLGANYLFDTEVTGLLVSGNAITAVETSRGAFPCDIFVNAAGAWSAQIASMAGLDIPVFPVRGQILCTEALRDQTLRCNLSTSDCYILQKAHGEIIIGSTTEICGFDSDVPLENLAGLAAGVKRAIPAMEFATVKRAWSGLRPGTPDEYPILGPMSGISNYFNATGGFRTGIVGAPLSAAIVVAHILGDTQPYDHTLFLADRFQTKDLRLSKQISQAGEH
jgi:hydrogen cyanide synthase HcnC